VRSGQPDPYLQVPPRLPRFSHQWLPPRMRQRYRMRPFIGLHRIQMPKSMLAVWYQRRVRRTKPQTRLQMPQELFR
jgi:hypothetical protein